MYKATKSLIVLALFACLSAFTTTHQAGASNELTSKSAAPDVMTSLTVLQTGPNSVLVSWTSSIDAPYTVTLEDLSTSQIVTQFVSFNNSEPLTGLQQGVKYLVTVSDADGPMAQQFIL